jgi:hypothetical protein
VTITLHIHEGWAARPEVVARVLAEILKLEDEPPPLKPIALPAAPEPAICAATPAPATPVVAKPAAPSPTPSSSLGKLRTAAAQPVALNAPNPAAPEEVISNPQPPRPVPVKPAAEPSAPPLKVAADVGQGSDQHPPAPRTMPGPAHTASLFEDIPQDGRQLWKWAEARGLTRWFQRLGRSWRLPGKLIDWQPADIAAAVAECQTKADPQRKPIQRESRPLPFDQRQGTRQ